MTERARAAESRAPAGESPASANAPAGRSDGLARHVLSRVLPIGPESAGQARELIARACREWGLDGIELDAKMVASELVENAVRYGGGPRRVRATLYGTALTVSVEDRLAAIPPRLVIPRPDQQGGRGMVLIDRLSEEWGYRPTPSGKVVWARLRAGEPAGSGAGR